MSERSSIPLAPPSSVPQFAPAPRPLSTPRTNADFRALLSTPRPDRTPHRTPHPSSGAVREKSFAKPKPRPKAPADGEAGLAYRDRAAERRDERNADYDDASRGPLAVAAAALTVAESQHLGGDEAHTHLVRGLDVALLARARATQAKAEEEAARTVAAAAVAAAAVPAPQLAPRTALGRAVLAAALPRASVGQVAQLDAASFCFSLGLEEVVPTRLLRVRSAAASVDVPVCAMPDEPLLRRATEAAARLRPGGKKLRRKGAAPSAAAVAPAMPLPAPVDEDDIFANVGPLPSVAAPPPVPLRMPVPAIAPAVVAVRPAAPAACVDEIYAAIEAAELAEGGPAAEAARAAREKVRLAELQAADEAPAYGELYPGGEVYASLLDGGSDDEDAAKEGGAAGAAKGRGRGKAEKAADAKLGAQLADVRRALTEKHGEKHESAFAKPKRPAAEAPAIVEDEAATDAKARAKRLKL